MKKFIVLAALCAGAMLFATSNSAKADHLSPYQGGYGFSPVHGGHGGYGFGGIHSSRFGHGAHGHRDHFHGPRGHRGLRHAHPHRGFGYGPGGPGFHRQGIIIRSGNLGFFYGY